jgi:hypothetical protein
LNNHNLISKIRWGTDDELDDLAFWINKWELTLE